MNKQEYIAALEKLNLPKSEFIILSGGSLLMHGLRETTQDLDFCFSKKLAKELDLYSAPKDKDGLYVPFENCQVFRDDFGDIKYDVVDGYNCESLQDILEFKRRVNRPKDQADIKKIEEFLASN